MKKTILLAALALGALSANATEGKKSVAIETLLASKATPVQSVQSKGTAERFTCEAKGEVCYPTDSWACCSGLCIDLACR